MADKASPVTGERRLSEIIREVKTAVAERSDVVIDMKEADQARISLLAEDLRPIVEAVPDEVELFDFAISNGLQPRLWIDSVAHVHMAQDRRTYRFIRETRIGRVVLAETSDLKTMSAAVARYIADRLVERQRILEGDFDHLRVLYGGSEKPATVQGDETSLSSATKTVEQSRAPALSGKTTPSRAGPASGVSTTTHPRADRGHDFVIGLLWFILGTLAGGGVIIAALWQRMTTG